MIEAGLIENCAPTLARLKTGSLFNHHFKDRKECDDELKKLNNELNPKDVYIELLKNKGDFYLLYVYRKSSLKNDFGKNDIKEFLKGYGYNTENIEKCISNLKFRLEKSNCFPHEIGAFLGYPLEDVKGFINDGGHNCKCCGLWKVYCNEAETMRLFEKLTKCTKVYIKAFSAGRTLSQMTVCSEI